MPRKSPAQRAAASAEWHRRQIALAYEEDDIAAPLAAAVRWLYAALAQKARDSPGEAKSAYRHATEQISAYAAGLQKRTAEAAKEGGRRL